MGGAHGSLEREPLRREGRGAERARALLPAASKRGSDGVLSGAGEVLRVGEGQRECQAAAEGWRRGGAEALTPGPVSGCESLPSPGKH